MLGRVAGELEVVGGVTSDPRDTTELLNDEGGGGTTVR